VVFQPAAGRAIRKSWPDERNAEEVRRQVMKLRYWLGRTPTDETGRVLDMDWSAIKAYRKEKIYELRVADKIGGQSNIRAIHFVAECPRTRETVIYVLTVMVKKRQRFTRHDIETFRCGRENVLETLRSNTVRLKVATR
jgi:hypothetical protein